MTSFCSAAVPLLAALLLTVSLALSLTAPAFPPHTVTEVIPPHPFNVTDLMSTFRLGELVTSPNGAWGVFSASMWDGNNTTKNLLLMNMNSGLASYLTFKKNISDFNPCWSSDSVYVFFLSTRSGSVQVHGIPSEGSDADVFQITDLPLSLNNLRWAPNDKFLSFSADVYLDCPADKMIECTVARDKAITAQGSNTGYLYESLYVRHWNTYGIEGKHSVLFVLPITSDNGYQPIYPALPISYGLSATSPVPPFGGIEQYAWAPDGSEIAFTAEIISHQTAWTTGWRIFTVDIDSKGPVAGSLRNIVDNVTQARTQNPAYSPDGQLLAYLAMDRPGYEADRLHINLFHRKTGGTTSLTSKWDRSVDHIMWSLDSTFLVVEASDQGKHKLWSVSVSDGNVQELVSAGHNTCPCWSGDSSLFFLQDSLTAPADVWMLDMASKQAYQITNSNYYTQVTTNISTPQEFVYSGANGDQIQSWFFPPVGWKEGQKYPLVVLIHGGPQGAWEDAWSYRWNPQNWAGHGYAVWAPNPHGSSGWGQSFTDAVIGEWGGKPFVDIVLGVQAVLAEFSWLDPKLVGALGGSYGGYIVNWINGNAPKDMFKCLVCHNGVFDTVAFYYSTDELFFPEYSFGGTPITNPALYNKWNPSAYAQGWTTPTMVIHGGLDYRVPLSEGLSTFTTLQRQNISSQLLFFPEEDHWILRPQNWYNSYSLLNQHFLVVGTDLSRTLNSIMWYTSVLAWLDQHLQASP